MAAAAKYVLLTSILGLFAVIEGALLKLWDSKSVGRDTYVEGSVINGDKISGETTGLFVDLYSTEEAQVETVENFPDIINIWMSSTGQSVPVTFKNMPKIFDIDMSKNKMTEITNTMFTSIPVVKLWLHKNHIKHIEDDSFGDNINIVSLFCNNIESFRHEWFKSPVKVTWLDLHSNDIKILEPDAFKPFTHLETINLAFNKIKTISDGSFSSRNIFKEINLAYNQLIDLNSKAFLAKVKITTFDIRFNRLTYLSKNVTSKLTIGETPLIDGNPWQCDCYLNHIIKWMHWNNYGEGQTHPKDREGEPRCVVPEGKNKTCVERNDRELIEYFVKNSSPPQNTKEKYCKCRPDRSFNDCYFI